MTHFAHSREPGISLPWQDLSAHLQETAQLSAEFAPFSLQEYARLAALWHDVGKYQAAFQRYIGVDPEASNESNTSFKSVPHSSAGAALAGTIFGWRDPRGAILALVIEAHHGALKAGYSIENIVEQKGRPFLLAAQAGGLPATWGKTEAEALVPRAFSGMAVRMLFSALVDADLLNTEAWDRGESRIIRGEKISHLADRLEAACQVRSSAAPISPVNSMRREVYEACVDTAATPPGCFTLTVPTGGGKTLSGMAFALRHAAKHGLHRVIVVAPYTSILEQTARVYREVLGDENVVEHHSNLAPSRDTDHNRQACENWDAPIIVTTSVQFFESLYAAHKAPCRKLHRIASSVILLDEVQTFPTGLLEPIHLALHLLVKEFGATVVHCTATQPLLAASKSVLKNVVQAPMREIVPDFARHFTVIQARFNLHRVGDLKVALSPEELADHVMQHETVLVIVHNRKEASELARMLGPECMHLSATMCAEHRSAVLMKIRRRLAAKLPCRVVATQLIEAGVDIDFPVVFRALAGLETLAQAAGRCNREMKGEAPGKFFVFRAPSEPPLDLRLGMQVTLDSYFADTDPDLNDPHLFPAYARRLLNLGQTDTQLVMAAERELDFPSVAERFRMIVDAGVSVVAPYGKSSAHTALVRAAPIRDNFRLLQRFTVSLNSREADRLYALGVLEPVLRGEESGTQEERRKVLWMVREGVPGIYDDRFGFGWQAGERIDQKHLTV